MSRYDLPRCTSCGYYALVECKYTIECTKCGTVCSEDYLERTPAYTENEMLIEERVPADVRRFVMASCSHIGLPLSVEECANDLFHSFTSNNNIIKAGHREACMLACIFYSQGVMNSGARGRKEFETTVVTSVKAFNHACTELLAHIRSTSSWAALDPSNNNPSSSK